MRRLRFMVMCSFLGALGFGACSLDPVPVLPGSDRNLDPQPEIPPGAGNPGPVGIDLDGDGVIDGYDTNGDGLIDPGTTGGVVTPTDSEGPPGDSAGLGGGGEGGAAGDTGI